MNISPRTGRVTLTKMDRQTVDRFASLADAMHHHLVQSKNEQDVKIGKAAFTAGVYAKVLLMTIDGLELSDGAKPDSSVAEDVSVDGQSGVAPPTGDLPDQSGQKNPVVDPAPVEPKRAKKQS